MADPHVMSGLRGMNQTMDTRCKAYEMREKSAIERTQRAKGRILEARRKISDMHEKRAYKV